MKQLLAYRSQCLATFIAGLGACLALHFADAYAWYLLDVAAGLDSSPLRYFGRRDTLIQPMNLVFLMPFVVVLLNRDSSWVRGFWFGVAAFLLLVSLFLIGEGGDRKGCKSCFSVLLIYLFVVPVPAVISSAWGLYKIQRSS